MKIIYIVTAGMYEDYSIRGVFNKKEEAQAFANSGIFGSGSGGAEVEEWPLNECVGFCRRLNYRYAVIEGQTGRGWEFAVNAHPKTRTPKPSTTVTKIRDGWYAVADSFVSPEHAKKLAEKALQAKLQEKTNS